MDVVKKIFSNKEVNNGASVIFYPPNQSANVLPEDYGANLSGLVYQLSGKYK